MRKSIYVIGLVVLGGALIIQSFWGQLEAGFLWVTYMRENPNNGKVEHKIAYWAVHDGLIFKAGTYE